MNRVDGFIRLFRLERAFSAASGVLITGVIVSGYRNVSWVHGFAALSVFFSALANFVLNDIHDLESDTTNGRPDRPLATGIIGKDTAQVSAFLCGILAVWLATLLPLFTSRMILVGLPFTLAYNIFLKRFIVFKNLFTGLANSGVVLVGASLSDAHLNPLVIFLAILGFFFSLSYEIMLDIADVKGDRDNGVVTVPVKFGAEKAAWISIIIGIVTVILTPLPYFINLDTRLLHNPLFLVLSLVSIADRLRILLVLRIDQSPDNVLELKTRLFRNLQLSGLGYLFGIIT